MDEMRSEIRAAFDKEQAGLAPVAALRHNIVEAATAQARPAPNLQWLAVAAAVILGILVVVGLMSTRFAHRASVPVPAATAPAASPSASPVASPSPITVAAADALIRATVTGAQPLLLPSAIPANWSALVTDLSSSFFTVTYTSPDAAKSVVFAIQVPNPPPPGPHGSQSNPNFHGDRLSLYQIDGTTLATSTRFLIWNEPGTWSQPNGLPGVPYVMSTTGLSDTEFWSMANSAHA